MKPTDKPKYCFQCASLIYRFALILFSDVFPFLKSQIICSTLLKVQKFRYFVHLPLPSTGGWACASTRGPQDPVNHITITMPKYKIQTKTENKLESLAAPLLAGLKCRATKKRRRIQHVSRIYGSTKMQQNIQKSTKLYKYSSPSAVAQ